MNEQRLNELVDSCIANILANPEVAISSSLNKIEEHSDFSRLISFGSSIVPLLLKHLQKEPDWVCVLALRKRTEQWPCQKQSAGILSEIAKDWLVWGQNNGYLNSTQK